METAFLEECLSVLARTPASFDALLRDLPEAWLRANEGPSTWDSYTVIAHLIHAEKTDWMPRLAIILEHGSNRPFDPFERQPELDGARTLASLLDEFRNLREENLQRLRARNLTAEHLALEGRHPALGPVTLRQLLATWTAHDLAHLLQISRIMAKRLKSEVGPWAEFLSVMK